MIAYAGTYTVEADKVIHHVDISWNEARTGTDQIRFFELDGNILTITTPPFKAVATRAAASIEIELGDQHGAVRAAKHPSQRGEGVA